MWSQKNLATTQKEVGEIILQIIRPKRPFWRPQTKARPRPQGSGALCYQNGSPELRGNLSWLGTFEYRSRRVARKVSRAGITSKVIPQKCPVVSAANEKGDKRPPHHTSSPKHAEKGRVGSLGDHHHHSPKNEREMTRHP